MVLTMVAKNEVKNRLRTQLRRQREERYAEHNLLHLLDIPEIKSATTIASYFSIGTEPDTSALNLAIIASGKTLLLPRINGQLLDWVQWDGSESTIATNGKFSEPIGNPITSLEEIDLVLVPALAIDPDGYRLGQGGGYYDRALPQMRAWKHGVVYPYERMEHDLPREPWDVPVNSW
jgi:5-formyltetrahydrofolate cyclo-ligase